MKITLSYSSVDANGRGCSFSSGDRVGKIVKSEHDVPGHAKAQTKSRIGSLHSTRGNSINSFASA